MPGINIDPVAVTQTPYDIVKVTLAHYPNRSKLTVLQELHDFPFMNRWMDPSRRRTASGIAIAEDVVIDGNGSAKMVRPFETHVPNVNNVVAKLQVPWRGCQADWSLEKREILQNSGSQAKLTQLNKIVKVRRAAADLDLANLLEGRAWQAPNSSSDDLNAHGVPYWLVPITSAQVAASAGGNHIGANPTGFSDVGGIDASASKYALWKSYADVWDNNTPTCTENDVRKMVRMHRRLKFRTPKNARDWESDAYSDFQGYLSEARLEAFEEKARANNESLGADLGKFSGQTTVRGTPLSWVEAIDDISTDPLVLINHRHWHVFCLEGDILEETTVAPSTAQHRVVTTFVDLTFNIVTLNRRLAGGRIDYVA